MMGEKTAAITTMIVQVERLPSAATTVARTTSGMARTASMIRLMVSSAIPLKYPVTSPRLVPTSVASSVASGAIRRMSREPASTRRARLDRGGRCRTVLPRRRTRRSLSLVEARGSKGVMRSPRRAEEPEEDDSCPDEEGRAPEGGAAALGERRSPRNERSARPASSLEASKRMRGFSSADSTSATSVTTRYVKPVVRTPAVSSV